MDKFVPDMYQKSLATINYQKLKKSGIKCLIIDLDNTIAPVTVLEPDKKIKDLFADIKDMGFKVIIMSNGNKSRVAPFKEGLNVDASASSKKPLKGKYKKIMKIYGFKDTEIACIGDQLVTDIFGANRMDMTSILVNPVSKNDLFLTRLINRSIEKRIIKKLEKKGLFEVGKYYE